MQLQALTMATAAASMGLADYDLRSTPWSLSVSGSTGLSLLQLPWWPTQTPAANYRPELGRRRPRPVPSHVGPARRQRQWRRRPSLPTPPTEVPHR